MVKLRRSLLAIVVGSAMISRAALAQYGSSSSLLHTVSVTVPPRVKVQVAALSPTSVSAVSAGSASSRARSPSIPEGRLCSFETSSTQPLRTSGIRAGRR